MATDEEKLVTDNLGLAYELSWKYYMKFNGLYELDELQSVAFLGLTKAAKTFDKDLGYVFSTYGYNCIKNEIRQYYRSNKKYNDNLHLSEQVDENGKTLEDITPLDYDLFEQIDRRDYYNKLYDEIDSLPDKYKIIMQYKLKGLAMVDIGKILKVSISQLSIDYNKALNILRYKFKDWRDI